jgi:hypothetical protein
MYIYPHEETGRSSDCPLVNCTELVDLPLPQYLLQPPSLIPSTYSFVSSLSSSPSNSFSLAVSFPYLPPVVLSLPQTLEGTISRFLTDTRTQWSAEQTALQGSMANPAGTWEGGELELGKNLGEDRTLQRITMQPSRSQTGSWELVGDIRTLRRLRQPGVAAWVHDMLTFRHH